MAMILDGGAAKHAPEFRFYQMRVSQRQLALDTSVAMKSVPLNNSGSPDQRGDSIRPTIPEVEVRGMTPLSKRAERTSCAQARGAHRGNAHPAARLFAAPG